MSSCSRRFQRYWKPGAPRLWRLEPVAMRINGNVKIVRDPFSLLAAVSKRQVSCASVKPNMVEATDTTELWSYWRWNRWYFDGGVSDCRLCCLVLRRDLWLGYRSHDVGNNSSSSNDEIDNGPVLNLDPDVQAKCTVVDRDTHGVRVRAKRLPPVSKQLLDAMHTMVVNLELPRKQVQISNDFSTPNAWNAV